MQNLRMTRGHVRVACHGDTKLGCGGDDCPISSAIVLFDERQRASNSTPFFVSSS